MTPELDRQVHFYSMPGLLTVRLIYVSWACITVHSQSPGGRGWIWGGCSDNVAFGEKISKQFVDALEDGHDSRAAVNLHNNEAGRLVRYKMSFHYYWSHSSSVDFFSGLCSQIQTFISNPVRRRKSDVLESKTTPRLMSTEVTHALKPTEKEKVAWVSYLHFQLTLSLSRQAIKATMRRACKCHGVSGSCSIQTCWMQLADFREVGNYLKMKHEQAKKLEMDKKPARAGNSADNRGAIAHAFRSIARTELIYLEDSPDYCVKNQSMGFQGTEGRECLKGDKNMSQGERKSCRRLCYECGLRVVEKRVEVVSSCNCKFHWCCTVKCDKCTQVVTKYYCARKESGRKPHNKTKRRHHARRH